MADRAVIDYHTSTPAHPMTYIPETLRQAREALLQSAAALHVIAQSLEGADEPASAPEPNESPVRHWIIDRPPTKEDADRDDDVAVSHRPGLSKSSGAYHYAPWYCVHPGTPWAPVDAIPDDPFDPTCLDRNGWIRSRLPTVQDSNGVGVVLIPAGRGGMNPSINYHLIVPGQPWAPWGSNPGVFEK